MRNRLLKLTRDSIPYIKQLRPLAKTVAGCVIFMVITVVKFLLLLMASEAG